MGRNEGTNQVENVATKVFEGINREGIVATVFKNAVLEDCSHCTDFTVVQILQILSDV